MKTTSKPRKAGLLVQADDLTVGKHYCVHSLKAAPNELLPVAGQAFEISAIDLPFFVGKLVSDPKQRITLNVRFLNIMRVTPDFAKAQAPSNAS